MNSEECREQCQALRRRPWELMEETLGEAEPEKDTTVPTPCPWESGEDGGHGREWPNWLRDLTGCRTHRRKEQDMRDSGNGEQPSRLLNKSHIPIHPQHRRGTQQALDRCLLNE